MIIVDHVSYRYERTPEGSRAALNDVSITIEEGEFVAVIGPNGSGKSTLGRCMNGLIHPAGGRVVVDGMDTSDAAKGWDVHKRVGMIFQNPDNQIVSTTVERELAFGLENLGVPSSEIRERVGRALDRFHLSPYRTHPPHHLSGGRKQRLAIAAVTAMRPRYLVCDEPTALLDPQGRDEILSLITTLRADYRMAVIYITQFPDEAVEADRVVMMSEGRLAGEGAPAQLLGTSERLARHGLGAPLTVYLAEALRARGLPVPADTLRPDDLLAALSRHPPANATASAEAPPSPGTPEEAFVEMRDVTYTYPTDTPVIAPALHGIDLRIGAGERVAVIGPNGSGKSTLLQHFNGLLRPGAGTVAVGGMDLAARGVDLHAVRRRIGLVFQFPEAQLFEETVYDDVAFGPRNTGVPEEGVRDRVFRALHEVRLDPGVYGPRTPFSLSGGERRRAAIAGVLAMRPRLLALDEPTAGLDAGGLRLIESMLKAFHGGGGTVILISHDMNLVACMAERVVVLDRGRVVADGAAGAVLIDHDLLTPLGLRPPDLVRILTAMKERGYAVRTAIFEVEAAAAEIVRAVAVQGDGQARA